MDMKKYYQKLLWIPAATPNNSILGYRIPLIKVDFTEKYPDRPHIWSLFLHTDQNKPPNTRVTEGGHWALLEFTNPVSEYFRESKY
jgi:hypothetical protein